MASTLEVTAVPTKYICQTTAFTHQNKNKKIILKTLQNKTNRKTSNKKTQTQEQPPQGKTPIKHTQHGERGERTTKKTPPKTTTVANH